MAAGERVAFVVTLLISAAPVAAAEPMYDLSREKVLYCVGYAHLDTQWRWDFCTTIDKYIKDTLNHNFERFEEFPQYVFNFTGSVRYEMMREYYPEKYERLKRYIAENRWFVSGSSVDEGDVNVPSAEAIIRQVLYGNEYFRKEFGRDSEDFMLPDCFGFPASMPSIWAHCGLKGFSTQKLTWGSAVGIPFKIGVWEGPDGQSVLAALDPGPYVGAIEGRVDLNQEWISRIEENGRKYGVFADYHYYGVGDQGGAPRQEDVRNYVTSMNNPDSAIEVALVSSDQLFKDITDEQKGRLPRYKGDLLLTEHSAGTLTSQSYMKRWNRKNEILANAAERAAVAAFWLGGAVYPREKLYRSWVRLLANQMHDILPGTSIPRAYTFSWNDEVVAMNGFAAVLTDSVGAIARALDTRGEGIPLIVYNPLSIPRQDVVEAVVRFKGTPLENVRVFDHAGGAMPTQVLERGGDFVKVVFAAVVPPVSWSVYHVREAAGATDASLLKITESTLENAHYRVGIDEHGDVASIVDKQAGDRELLAGPARLVFTREHPLSWPAWNMDWYDRKKPPFAAVTGPAKVRIVERGPVRVALEVEREAQNSIIRQQIRLAAGDAGRRIEFVTDIDWQSTRCALKASFPLTVGNPSATYNWGMGTIDRGNNNPTKYEVPSHEWFDLTDASGEYGVTILEDSKFGSDKPSDSEVRLTLLYTPGVRNSYLDQHSQDWGRHEMTYALVGHSGDWRQGQAEWQGRRLNQPLRAFQTTPHDGPLGPFLSLVSLNTPQVDIRAIKMAENSEAIIVRLQEFSGRDTGDFEVAFAAPLDEAVETDGQERPIGPAEISAGKLRTRLGPYRPRTFAVRLVPAEAKIERPRSQPVTLAFDCDVISGDGEFADGGFDAAGRTVPAEMLPARLTNDGIEYALGSGEASKLNAVACRGQSIALPDGDFERVYVLAAAEGDSPGTFFTGNRPHEVSVASWTGFVGQWDDRVWDREFEEVDHHCEGRVTAITPGFIKRDPIAWFCTHRHHPQKGNEAYRFSYLFQYGMDLRPGDRELRLPDNPAIKVLAVSVAAHTNAVVWPSAPLYDDFTGREPITLRHVYPPKALPVFEGLDPAAVVSMDRQSSYESLSMGPPSGGDYADRGSGRGVVFRYTDAEGELRPHPRSGLVEDTFPRLNDGEFAQNEDDTVRCVWYDSEGRFFVDLQENVPIARINTYSRHRGGRAPQYFSLWGSDAAEMPDPLIGHGKTGGWKLLAVVDTKPLGEGGIHGTSIRPKGDAKSLGRLRHLLWIAENRAHGTFFTEIDIHAAQ